MSTIIKKEVKEGKGMYVIEVDKDEASKVPGSNYAERVNNAIKEFLTPPSAPTYPKKPSR